jgi:transcriptional regulator with XRE-family HTH domain
MNLVELAQRIKRVRREQNLTLEEVAAAAGLTRSWLSKVENFRVTPSLPALANIAQALNVPLADLVEGLDRRPQIALIRAAERKSVRRDEHQSGIVYEALAHRRDSRRMDPFLLHVPAGDSRREALSHDGEEFLMVISGSPRFEYGEQSFELAPGDCLYFDASVPHRLVNADGDDAQVLCVFEIPRN